MYAEYVSDLVHEPTQSHDAGLDLTVASVHEVVSPGRVDFGGGELDPAETVPRDGARRNPDDDYEWWTLSEGQYLLSYNESVSEGATVRLQPRTELLERGASHPTLEVDELPRIPLSVGGAGLKIKENARATTVVDAWE